MIGGASQFSPTNSSSSYYYEEAHIALEHINVVACTIGRRSRRSRVLRLPWKRLAAVAFDRNVTSLCEQGRTVTVKPVKRRETLVCVQGVDTE